MPVFLGLWLVGCAGSRPPADAGFRAIQVHEAEIAAAQRGLSSCAPSRDAEARICAATHALCEQSLALADDDARARCLRANDACVAAREHVRATCATQAP